MAIRENLIQARSLYVGVSPNVAPASSNLGVDGSIGIGTPTPNERLHIVGNTGTRIRISSSDNYHIGNLGWEDTRVFLSAAGYGSPALGFDTAGSERMRITNGGNVGIGTTNPNRKLTVTGEISSNYGSNQGALWLGEIALQNAYFTSYGILDYTMHNGGGYSDVMRIQGNGRVGIGTTNPGSQLQVGGYFQIESNANYMGMFGFNRNVNNGQILNPSYGAYQLQNYQGTLQIQIYNSSGSGITEHRFYNNGNVNFNGQLGVTTNPIASLDNQGGLGTYRQRGVTTMTTDILYADGTNATRYEIARVTIDYNDWNETGTIEIDLYEKYWSDGLKKRYIVTYGYSAQGNKYLVEMSGIGVNNFMVSLGAPVTITGDIRYIPIYVDLRYYSRCNAIVRTNRNLTTNNPPWVGEIWFNNAPSMTYISDFSPDSAVYAGNVIGGNTIFPSGNVGIGTSAPPARLAVAGNNAGLALIGDTGLTHYTGISLNNNLSSGTYNFLSSPYDNSLFINRPSGNNINFRENNVDQMVIRYGGLVGINTTNPQGYLDVYTGSANMTTYDYGVDLKVNAGGGFARSNRQYDVQSAITSFLGSYGNSTTGVERTYWTIGNRNSDVTGYTLTNGIHLLANGNVGIGTNDPNSYPYGGKLNVNGSISSSGSKIGFGVTDAFTLNGIDTAHYGMSSNFNLVQLSGYYGLVFATNGAERMRVADGGNIGIGTTAPVNLLHLSAANPVQRFESTKPIEWTTDGEALGSINFYKHYGLAQGASIRMLQDGGIYSYNQASLAFYTNDGSIDWVTPIERMRITSKGRVGIDTFTPTEKLEVNGNINISPASFTPGFLSFYNDLAGQLPFITNYSGVRWGYKNGDPGFPSEATDMSIINNYSMAGYFGSIMSFKIQPYVVPSPSFTDTQVDKLNLVPYNFFTGTGGVGINTTNPQASLHVYENGGLPPYYRNDFRAAKFEWDFGGVVFPNVPEDNRNMIPGEPGMVIFNTTVRKLQVFDGANWINLH